MSLDGGAESTLLRNQEVKDNKVNIGLSGAISVRVENVSHSLEKLGVGQFLSSDIFRVCMLRLNFQGCSKVQT